MCDDFECITPQIVGPGGIFTGCLSDFDCASGDICDDFECISPPIVGPGGLAPGLCQTDSDCDEDAGEVCDAGECFLPTLVGGGFDISRPGGGLIFLGGDGDSCSMGFECASGICLSGACFEPSVSVDCIVDADCDEDAGEVCDAGVCFAPTIVGPGGLAPGLCQTDSDCDENAGEVCDAGECF